MAVILLSFIQATLQTGTVNGGAKIQTPTLATLQSILIAPSSNTLAVGTTYTLVATGTFSDGSSSNITSSCAWTSSNTAVATIAATGSPRTVTAVSVGSSSITCVMQGITGVAQVTVVNVITISPLAVPVGTDGQPYIVTFSASGATAPYHFSITSGLPALQAIGLGFTAPQLFGTLSATSVGSYGFTLTVTDSASPANTTTRNYVLTVNSSTGLSRIAIKPQVWANVHEADLPNPCDVAHNCYIKHIRANNTGDFNCDKAGLQAAIDQWAQAPNNVWWWVKVDDTLSMATGGKCTMTSTTTLGWILKAKATGFPTGFLIFESEHPNPAGRTVCNHMVAISLVTTVRNPACDTNPNIDDLSHMWGMVTTGTGGYGGQMMTAVSQMNGQGYGPWNIVFRDVEMVMTTGIGTNPLWLNTCGGSAGCPVNPMTLNASLQHFGIERSYLHSDWIVPAPGGSSAGRLISPSGGYQGAGIVMGCHLCWLEWSYIDRITAAFTGTGTAAGNEGKVLVLGQAKGGVKLAHNYIEGGELGFIAGGAGGTDMPMSPNDVEVRANVWTRDPAWETSRTAGTGNPTGWQDCRHPVKNAIELKEGIRWLINGNILEESQSCAQAGQGLTLNVRSCSGGAMCDNYAAEIADITFTNNVTRNVTNDIQTAARSSVVNNGSIVSRPGRRWNIENNLTYNMRNRVPGTTPQFLWQSGDGNGLQWQLCTASRDSAGQHATVDCTPGVFSTITNASWVPAVQILTLTANTTFAVGQSITIAGVTPTQWNGTFNILSIPAPNQVTVQRATNPNANTSGTGGTITHSGVTETVTTATWRAASIFLTLSNPVMYFPSTSAAISVTGATPSGYNGQCSVLAKPAANQVYCAKSADPGPWVSGGATRQIGYSQTNLAVGEPVWIRGCTPSSFDTPIGNAIGPPALPGTNGTQPVSGNGLTIVYANIGPPNETATGCVFRGIQGAPFESTFIHNTNVWTGGSVNWPWIVGLSPPSGQPASYYGTFARGNTYQDDILAPNNGTTMIVMSSSQATGLAGQVVGFDTSTLIMSHLLFTGNKANQLNAYPSSNAGTIWSPPSAGIFCAGATADSTCIGFNGYMNGASWVADPVTIGQDPLVFYALHPSSLYKAGGPRAAHDGTDMGADMNAIRNALSETKYSGCAPGECGPTGPFPD